jgi:hypothetical protein
MKTNITKIPFHPPSLPSPPDAAEVFLPIPATTPPFPPLSPSAAVGQSPHGTGSGGAPLPRVLGGPSGWAPSWKWRRVVVPALTVAPRAVSGSGPCSRGGEPCGASGCSPPAWQADPSRQISTSWRVTAVASGLAGAALKILSRRARHWWLARRYYGHQRELSAVRASAQIYGRWALRALREGLAGNHSCRGRW